MERKERKELVKLETQPELFYHLLVDSTAPNSQHILVGFDNTIEQVVEPVR